MKSLTFVVQLKYRFLLASLILVWWCLPARAQTNQADKFIIEQDSVVEKEGSGPHDGGGASIGYNFFNNVANYKTAFRKRILKPGSSIGYHFQETDEIYYVISGTGMMVINSKNYPVKPGDAILTRTGSSHGIKPDANKQLTLIIVYQKK